MRIFLSYAREQRSIAERLAFALRAQGHDVFFDRTSLPPGQTYDEKIRHAIDRCHLFVFLISPESIEPASYCLTELDIMGRRAGVPCDRVLGVILTDVNIDAVPGYLRALNLLHPVGDLVADVLSRVADVGAARRQVVRRRLLVAAAVLIAAGAAGAYTIRHWPLRQVRRGAATADGVAVEQSLSVFAMSDQNSEIVDQVKAGEPITILAPSADPNWIHIKTARRDGWAMAQDLVLQRQEPGTIKLGQGYGFQGSFWKLFFTRRSRAGGRRTGLASMRDSPMLSGGCRPRSISPSTS